MGAFYFDSSGLVKSYVQETGTAWVQAIINAKPANESFITLVTAAEIVAAITRRRKMNLISVSDATTAIAAFKGQLKGQFKVLIVDSAMDLAEKHKLRGYDSIQLASALTLEAEMTANGVGPLTFISADVELNQAAILEGLLIEDPNQH